MATELKIFDMGYKETMLSFCVNNAKEGIVVSNEVQETSNGQVRMIESVQAGAYCYMMIGFDEETKKNTYKCLCSQIVFE